MKTIHILAVAATAMLAGCATWTFKPMRSSKFVNERNEYILVDYGIEEHESTFIGPGGVKMPFKSKLKVRVEMPDGTRFVAYQNMSTEGRLYPHVRNQNVIFIQNEADIVQHLLRCRREARVVIITRVVGHHHLPDLHSPFRFPGVRTNTAERIEGRRDVANDFFVGLIEFVHMVRRFVDVNNHLVAIRVPLGRRIFHDVIANGNHEVRLFHDDVRIIPLR